MTHTLWNAFGALPRLALALAVLLLVGCATPATQQAMSVGLRDISSTNKNLLGKVRVEQVSGGEETSAMWKSKVDAASFKGALEKSLALAGYQAPQASAAVYTVTADLKALDQPFGGFTMDVISNVDYTVRGAGKEIRLPVSAQGSASTSDTWVGTERLRLANERSIKENIRLFLLKLAEQSPW